MKLKAWIPLVLALVLGLAAAKLTRDAMRRGKAAAGPDNRVALVTAARDIEPGQSIGAADLAESKVAPEAMPPGAFQGATQVVDRVVVTRISKGQPVLDGLLAPVGSASGVQALIPPGMRAITMQVNEFTGVAGLLAPGCRVDVVSALRGDGGGQPAVARTIVQNVEVRAVGQRTSAAAAPADGSDPAAVAPAMAQSVTLLVTPAQAETLQLASMGSTTSLVLRNSADAEPFESEGTRMADLLGGAGRVWRLPMPVLKPGAADPNAGKTQTVKAVGTQREPSRSRTVTIIRATKEEKLEVAVPRVPPTSGWITNNDPGAATGND